MTDENLLLKYLFLAQHYSSEITTFIYGVVDYSIKTLRKNWFKALSLP